MNRFPRWIISFVFCVICLVLVFYNRRNADRHNLQELVDQGNINLAYSFLAHDIQLKTIRVYVSTIEAQASYRVNDFRIFVIPIKTSGAADYAANFLQHHYQAIVMYACHVWDINAELAKSLMSLLDNVEQNAAIVISDYRENGTLT